MYLNLTQAIRFKTRINSQIRIDIRSERVFLHISRTKKLSEQMFKTHTPRIFGLYLVHALLKTLHQPALHLRHVVHINVLHG